MEIDLNRNLPGTTSDIFKGFGNEINDFYISVTGEEARYTSYTVYDVGNSGSTISLIPIFTNIENHVLLRITFSPLMQSVMDNDNIFSIDANISTYIFLFTISPITDVVLLNCLNDTVTCKVPPIRNNTYMAV